MPEADSVAHTLDVPGARLYYERRGVGLLLLLIGSPMDSTGFSGLAGALAGRYTVVTCDPRGAFHRAVPDVADGEYAWAGGLQQEGSPLQEPVLAGVGSGEDESPLVALDRFGEPAREWLSTDEDEQAGGWDQLGFARVAVPPQPPSAPPAGPAPSPPTN